MSASKAKELAEAHAGYIEDLLIAHGEDSVIVEKIMFHYKTAFVHGFKHAYEEMESEMPREFSNGMVYMPPSKVHKYQGVL